ncbi:hypothetical protein ACLBWS_12805 [Brucellaceae bacterium D45D]
MSGFSAHKLKQTLGLLKRLTAMPLLTPKGETDFRDFVHITVVDILGDEGGLFAHKTHTAEFALSAIMLIRIPARPISDVPDSA